MSEMVALLASPSASLSELVALSSAGPLRSPRRCQEVVAPRQKSLQRAQRPVVSAVVEDLAKQPGLGPENDPVRRREQEGHVQNAHARRGMVQHAVAREVAQLGVNLDEV